MLCHHWVQLPIAEYIKMKQEGEVFCGKGYKYKDQKGSTYIEFHVDNSEKLTDIGKQHPFGGSLSVRKPKNEKPLIIFGQDECIFKQFIFRNKCWNRPNGESPLMPKDEGQGLMVSGFVSREYGFNMALSDDQLRKVNKHRENKHYIDEDAAKSKTGTSKKANLKHSPFRCDLEYGANNEGYWTYDDMIMQVEDCIDCLKVINEDKYQYLFLFDHSNGHDRAAPDALKAELIRKNYGGKQPQMRHSIIDNETYLGPYNHTNKLKVGQIQHMNFTQTDDGPFYLSPQQRQEQRHDQTTGNKTIKLTKPELITKLKEKGVSNPKGGTKKIHKLCKTNKVDITTVVPDITEGWVGKPKGALQLLYERGWINPTDNPKDYTMKGKIDEFGNRDTKRSLKRLLLQQPDFMNEKTMLQHYCEKLGVRTDRTPVAHCEVAGERIEFDWGYSKIAYRSKPISLKQNKSKFHSLVESVLSSKTLTLSICRANARRARQYMLAYMTLAATDTEQSQPTHHSQASNTHKTTAKEESTTKHKVTHSLIEECVGLF